MLTLQRNLDPRVVGTATHVGFENWLVMSEPVTELVQNKYFLFDRKSAFFPGLARDIDEGSVESRLPEGLLVTGRQDVSPETKGQFGNHSIGWGRWTAGLGDSEVEFSLSIVVPPAMVHPVLVFVPLPHNCGVVCSNMIPKSPMDVVAKDNLEVAEVDQQSASYLSGPVIQLNSPVSVASTGIYVASESWLADEVFELVCWRGHRLESKTLI